MAIPAAASDLEQFVALLEKHALLSPDQMSKARGLAAGQSDPRALARDLVQHGWLTKWQAAQLLAGGSTFHLGKYRLLNQVGSGQQGRVFLADHSTMARRALLRTLPRRAAEQPELLKRFLAEAQTAGQLDHRNLVHVYDVNSDGDRYFVVMEFVDGRDLFAVVSEDGPLPPWQAVEYIRQAAEGIAHGHAHRVLHRELSPGKIIVDSQGAVKVLEMGLPSLDDAGETGPLESTSSPHSAAGYLAPEQCQSKPQVDERTDIYALGATLYYLLSGQSPLSPSLSGKPQDLLQLRRDVPPTLIKLCLKMMAENPADRFASAKELAEALASWLERERPAAPAPAAASPSGAYALGNGGRPLKVAKALEDGSSPVIVGGLPDLPALDPLALPTTDPLASWEKSGKPVVQPANEMPLALMVGAVGGGLAVVVAGILIAAWIFLGGSQTDPTPPVVQRNVPATNPPLTNSVKPPVAVPPVSPENTTPDPPQVAVKGPPTVGPASTNLANPEVTVPTPPTPVHVIAADTAANQPKPFAALTAGVELPPPADGVKAVLLGSVKIEPGVHLFMALDGPGAKPGPGAWNIKRVDDANWQISQQGASNNAAIAQLLYKNDNVYFRWTADALSQPKAAELANCALIFATGTQTHRLALRAPRLVAPLSVNLDRAMKAEVDIGKAADPRAVRVAFQPLAAAIPTRFDKKSVLNADKDSATLIVGDEPADQMLKLEVRTELGRSLTITVTTEFKIADAKTQKYTKDNVSALKSQLESQRRKVTMALEVARKAQTRLPPRGVTEEQHKQNTQAALTAAEDQLKLIEDAAAQLKKLEEQHQALANQPLNFRVYYTNAAGEEIELATTGAP